MIMSKAPQFITEQTQTQYLECSCMNKVYPYRLGLSQWRHRADPISSVGSSLKKIAVSLGLVIEEKILGSLKFKVPSADDTDKERWDVSVSNILSPIIFVFQTSDLEGEQGPANTKDACPPREWL